jgi:hypothetical protein
MGLGNYSQWILQTDCIAFTLKVGHLGLEWHFFWSRIRMGILTDDMKRIVREQRLGYVAIVCPDENTEFIA